MSLFKDSQHQQQQQQHTRLPDSIKIDDITSGKIDPNLIYDEIERLKVEINILRNDMAMFLKALVSIKSNQSQQDYYLIIVSRLNIIQTSIKDYCEKYNKLLPIINLAQIKLGHEVEAPPPTKSKSATSTLNNTPISINKSTPSMNTTSNIKIDDKNKKTTKKNSISNKNIGSTSNQPIIL
ncbi:unnamed protein product [Candida verbasci]|uniref:Uncharacterized protein n=1 Tax=Candida verbasci TaxID=1227364 RepID=A0A9W4TYJ5_9ASCO|nr:unnamed protein product [Candida verbasci]